MINNRFLIVTNLIVMLIFYSSDSELVLRYCAFAALLETICL